MFEALEIGRKVRKKDFVSAELELRQALLNLQFELADKPYPVILIVSGVEGAGKGEVVHRLNEWMDPRGIETQAFWDRSDEEEARPFYWRFWRAMPAKGRMGIFFGSWYTRPIIERAMERSGDAELDAEMQRINEFEQMLTDDGAVIIKLWFHLDKKTFIERMDAQGEARLQSLVSEQNLDYVERYNDFRRHSERVIRQTDTACSPWHLIESTDPNYRDLTAGETLRQALTEAFQRPPRDPELHMPDSLLASSQPTVLDNVPGDAALTPEQYKKLLKKYQNKLADLSWKAREKGVATVAVFEGWDAAGKGSALRRVTQSIDPRLYRLVQFAAPTDEERAHHYLWRFWRQLERDGKATFFDRSWYGRVLVERVEGYAHQHEWQRAYSEINRFEEQLASHGTVVLKFWLHISKEEQLARFKLREQTPHKQYKITEEDWRNREKWHDYEMAIQDMVTHTSTRHAPWTLVAGNNKHYARIQILRTFCDRLQKALK